MGNPFSSRTDDELLSKIEAVKAMSKEWGSPIGEAEVSLTTAELIADKLEEMVLGMLKDLPVKDLVRIYTVCQERLTAENKESPKRKRTFDEIGRKIQ